MKLRASNMRIGIIVAAALSCVVWVVGVWLYGVNPFGLHATYRVAVPAGEVPLWDQEYFRLFLLVTLCGSTIIIIVAGTLLYAYGSYVNRQLLRMQHNELKEAQHLAQMGSWSYDYVAEQLYCSDEFKTHFLMLDEASIKPTLDDATLAHVHPEDKAYVKHIFKEALKSNTGYNMEYRMVRKDGEIRNVQAKAVIEQDGKGNKLKIAGTMRDITEEKRERNRMNRLTSEFISIVSHELRTPLTSIRGSLALLEDGVTGDLSEKSLELVKIAHRNSRRLIAIVNDILDMEKLAAGKMKFEMKSLEFTEIIKQAVESNEAYASNFNVKYVMRELPESAYIWGDANRLIQVITNLLSNAAKFSPKGERVEIRLIMLNRHWRLEVRDFGAGIPALFRPRIFGAFAQAEDANTRQKGGTGLGLNITKIMVEQMDGMIGFESEEGKGALFWVSFAML